MARKPPDPRSLQSGLHAITVPEKGRVLAWWDGEKFKMMFGEDTWTTDQVRRATPIPGPHPHFIKLRGRD